MKRIYFASHFALGIALSLLIVGCQQRKPGITPLPNGGIGSGGTSGTSLPSGTPLNGGESVGNNAIGGGPAADFNPDDYNQDRSAFAADTVYFDYDNASIKSSEESKVDAVAAALKSDPSAKLLVEGNCDERGTEEYNRALGERRALSAREALAGQGIDAGRVATRSYGEDRPADPGHDESAWAKNRRDEFVLLHPK